MEIDYYTVFYKGTPLAQHMLLQYAIMFVKAVMQEYWQTNDMELTIKREVSTGESGMGDE